MQVTQPIARDSRRVQSDRMRDIVQDTKQSRDIDIGIDTTVTV
jgi:hypothetical protein